MSGHVDQGGRGQHGYQAGIGRERGTPGVVRGSGHEEPLDDSQFVLANNVIFSSIGAGQSIRGINYRNIRPDYILIDDLYDEEDINNVEATEKKNDWFWGHWPQGRAIRSPDVHARQGTAINGHDLMEELKKGPAGCPRPSRVSSIRRKASSFGGNSTTRRADLFADFEDMPTVIFNREVQGERRDAAESIVKKAWLRSGASARSFMDSRELVRVDAGCDPSVERLPCWQTTQASSAWWSPGRRINRKASMIT